MSIMSAEFARPGCPVSVCDKLVDPRGLKHAADSHSSAAACCRLQVHEQSSGLTLTCCSQLLVVGRLPREDLLRQLLGRIHRFGQQQQQRATFLVGRGSVHEAMYDRCGAGTVRGSPWMNEESVGQHTQSADPDADAVPAC
jgi:hypothetical protein